MNMTQMYKLKKEARQFFTGQANEVKPMEWWANQIIPPQLLEEVSNVHVEYGRKVSDAFTMLKEWGTEGSTAKFEFTIVVSDISHSQYNQACIPGMMDKIQEVIDQFFK